MSRQPGRCRQTVRQPLTDAPSIRASVTQEALVRFVIKTPVGGYDDSHGVPRRSPRGEACLARTVNISATTTFGEWNVSLLIPSRLPRSQISEDVIADTGFPPAATEGNQVALAEGMWYSPPPLPIPSILARTTRAVD